MRQIKFRGKSVDNGEWAYGDLITKPIHHECCILENGCINHSVDPATVSQFTGLLDKNGKEIWEGDYLSIHNPEEDDGMGENPKHSLIEFKCGAFQVEYDFGDYELTSIGWAIEIWKSVGITCEVIGNLHDSPSLTNR